MKEKIENIIKKNVNPVCLGYTAWDITGEEDAAAVIAQEACNIAAKALYIPYGLDREDLIRYALMCVKFTPEQIETAIDQFKK